MPWYYAESGKQAGPFTDEQFQSLVAAGTVRPETLVWRDGLENWAPYSQVSPAPVTGASTGGGDDSAGSAVAATSIGVVCSECGQTFPPDQVIRIADANVCATCKPRLVQRLTEGAAPSSMGGTVVDEQTLLQREYRVEIGTALERAWKLFSANAGAIIGTTLLLGLVFLGCHAVAIFVSMFIPMGNMILQPLYVGPLTGGLLWYMLRMSRGEPTTMSDAFAGFSSHFGQLFLATLVQTLFTLLCVAPMIGMAIFAGVGFAASGGRGMNTSMNVGLIAGFVVAVLIGIAAAVYVTTLWTHSLLLIVDKRMNFWPAMQLSRKLVSKSWGMTFLFILVAGIISGAGAIACLIGLIVTVPLYFAMKAYFYDDNFRDFQPSPGTTRPVA